MSTDGDTKSNNESVADDSTGSQPVGVETLVEDAENNKNKQHPGLNLILDIPVTLSLEVGKTNISIRDLLKLNQGSIVELDRIAGEPLDVYVNSTLIAKGEVVVVNDNFGIRLTNVISQNERIDKLGSE